MRTEGTKTVTVVVRTYKCDHCDFTVMTEAAHSPRRQGMEWCEVCKGDCCRNHVHYFQESRGSDYPDITCCAGCYPKVKVAWEWALENADRHDDMKELTINRLSLQAREPQP